MPRIIRPGRLIPSDQVVKIPDALPLVPEPPPPVEPELPQEEKEKEPLPEAKLQEILGESAVERANDVAQKVLQRARAEREEILEKAQLDARKIREEARQAAYQQALDEKEQEISGCLAQVDRMMSQLQEQQRSFLKQYEEGILSLALDIVKKVLGTSIHEHEELMLPLVKDAVASVKNTDWISVQISEKLPRLMELLKSELAQRQDLSHVEITAADLPEDSCIISTPDGIVDASVSTQLANLKAQAEKKD